MLALVTMETLLRARCFWRLASPGSVTVLHKDYRTVPPQNFSNYESMKQEFKLEIPEYFNFAKDVLDQWTNMEKVWSKGQSNCSFSDGSDFCPQGKCLQTILARDAAMYPLIHRTVPHSKELSGSTC